MKVKRLKDGEIRVLRISEKAIEEFLWEMLIEKLKDYFDLLDPTTVCCELDIDFDKRDLIFVVRDKKEYCPDKSDFGEIADFVGETAETLFAPNRYVRLKKDEKGLRIIQD